MESNDDSKYQQNSKKPSHNMCWPDANPYSFSAEPIELATSCHDGRDFMLTLANGPIDYCQYNLHQISPGRTVGSR